MNELKYTTDGKKVVVIGNLNSQEKIVQEIFVTETGQEVPSGENFVVKSLHDTPVKSWKSYEQERYENLEKSAKANYESLQNEISRKHGKLKDQSALLSDRIIWAAEALKTVSPETFDFLVKFCSGAFTVAVVKEYGEFKILTLDELVSYNEHDRWSDVSYKNLRLISLYGRSDGKLDYKVNAYGDGSGSDKGNVIFFENNDKAIEYVKSKIMEKETYTSNDIKTALELGIELDREKSEAFHNSIKESKMKVIEELNQKIAEANDFINNYTPESYLQIKNTKKK